MLPRFTCHCYRHSAPTEACRAPGDATSVLPFNCTLEQVCACVYECVCMCVCVSASNSLCVPACVPFSGVALKRHLTLYPPNARPI